MKRLRTHHGFTLIELIISIAIVAVIVVTCLFSIRLAISSQEIGERKVDSYQRLRFIADQLTNRIRSTYPVFVPRPGNSEFKKLKKGKPKPKKLLAFEGKEDSIRFITTSERLNSVGKRAPTLHEVRFLLKKDVESGQSDIVMTEREFSYETVLQDNFETEKETISITLAENVADLKFRYFQIEAQKSLEGGQGVKNSVKYQGEWVDTITTEPIEFLTQSTKALSQDAIGAEARMSLPRAVEVSVGIWETLPPESEEKPEQLVLPPTVISLHSGMVFERPPPEKGTNENPSG